MYLCHLCVFIFIIPPYANKINFAILLVESKESVKYSLHYNVYLRMLKRLGQFALIRFLGQ